MKTILFRFAVVWFGAIFGAFNLPGASVGPSDCDTCFGAQYTLSDLGEGSTPDVHRFRFTVNTLTGSVPGVDYTGADTDWIRNVSVHISTGALAGAELESTDAPGGTSGWGTLVNAGTTGGPGPTGSEGCTSAPGSGAVCFYWNGTPRAGVGAIYNWTFNVTFAPGSSILDPAPFRVGYRTSDDRNAGITSETVGVPEGYSAEIPILLSGLVGLWFWDRRRTRRLPIH